MRSLVLLASGFIVTCGLWAQPAVADDREHCIYSSKAANTKASIDACTRLISSGRFSGEELIKLYESRMNSFHSDNQYVRSISDANDIITKFLPQPQKQKITNEYLKQAYYIRGSSNYWSKQPAKAIPDLSAVIRDFPDDYNALYLRGASYLDVSNFGSAIADFDETLRIQPQHSLVHKNRSLAYEQTNDFPRALADARHVLKTEQAKGYTATSELEIVKRIEQKLAASGGRAPAPVAAATTPSAPAPQPAAAPADDKEHCIYSSKAANTKASIEVCTRLIASGRFRGEELAKFMRRGWDHCTERDCMIARLRTPMKSS